MTPVQITERIRRALVEAIDNKETTSTKLSAATGINDVVIRQFKAETRKLNFEQTVKLALALGLEVTVKRK